MRGAAQTMTYLSIILLALFTFLLLRQLYHRLQLSRAKHPSLSGHAKISRALSAQVPYYRYPDEDLFSCDGADDDLAAQRKAAFYRLASELRERMPASGEENEALASSVSDLQFTNSYRVPFQFRDFVQSHLSYPVFASKSDNNRIRDRDGNWTYDLGGSYGVNLFGFDFYKACIDRGVAKARRLGPALGPYHPVVADNVARLRKISGLDEVSFHMSGTEAVMQAVRLARYHTRRRQLVMLCGSYHGWWDGVQPGIGNRRRSADVYTLRDMSERTLNVLRSRTDIACVLVNPLQALHPNAGASTDAMLINSERSANPDVRAYKTWLKELREVCSSKGIVLIFDEVFVGFRFGLGGAQELFGVAADMVTYGKTLGGGLPVGVLCGRAHLMKRYCEERPTDVCFARGTFNSHPYVMTCMNEFLQHVMQPVVRAQLAAAESVWNDRARKLNHELRSNDLPVRVRNLSSVWTVTYTRTSRYNWMFQFYLRSTGISLAWIGTGRLIFSHSYTDDDFDEVRHRFVTAAERMFKDGWWAEIPGATNRSIKRQVFREMLSARISASSELAPALPAAQRPRGGHDPSDQSTPLSAGTEAISDKS